MSARAGVLGNTPSKSAAMLDRMEVRELPGSLDRAA
jgi:hypothetical protein